MARALRRAFSDQSDGHARVEAVSSLLLSEHHLQASAGVTTASTTKSYLETRKSLRLDANVPAAKRSWNRGAAFPTPDNAETTSCSTNVERSSVLFGVKEAGQQEVGVDSVLKEVAETNRNQRLRRLQRYRGRVQGRGGDEDSITGLLLDVNDEHNRRHQQRTEGKPSTPGGRSEENGAPCNRVSNPGASQEGDDLAPRLALAASVSILDGIVGGDVDDRHCFVASSVGGSVGGAGASSGSASGGQSDDVRAMIGAIRRSGFPLLMVQGTEDAFVWSPLPLVLQEEVCACQTC